MAKSQKVMWTALPNGLVPGSGGKKLRLSIFVSPRLEDDVAPGRLDNFPNFSNGSGANWASMVNAMSFRVEVMNNLSPNLTDGMPGGAAITQIGTYEPVSQASPELWDLMFKPSTLVPDSLPKIPAGLKVNSFSVPKVIKQVQDQYIAVGANPLLVSKLPLVNKMVTPAGLTFSPIMRLLPAIQRPTGVRVIALSADADPAFREFEKFHAGFEAPDGGVSAQAEPVKPVPKRPHMDFHSALSSLGQFPGIMRGLGMIIDLEIPFDSRLRSGRRMRIVPTTAPTGSASPWTAYSLTPGALTRKGVVSAATFATSPKSGDLRGGYKVMRTPATPSKNPVTIATVDVDFAGLALKATAVSAAKQIKEVQKANLASAASVKAAASSGVNVDVARPIAGTVSPSTTYEPMGLPGLGPSTLSLSLNNAGAKVKGMVDGLAFKEALLDQNKDKLILNYAEDVSRGHRIDVWDSVTKKWHKLCARTGVYSVADTPIRFVKGSAVLSDESSTPLTDEGWIETAAISDPNKTEGNEIPDEIWVHEHMFDWTGWSLAVPRPGAALAVNPDGSSGMIRESVGPDQTTHPIGSWIDPDFPLATEFSVPDGTLPRKRFGTTYRFRMRSVDLAGNSVEFAPGSPTVDPGGTADTNPTVSDRVVNRRTDPVKAPVVVITEPMKPGESPAVLVVRSNFDTPPASIPVTSRHITPPKSSVEMAEELGGLDDAFQPGKPVDPTLYSMLAERDSFEFLPETAIAGNPKTMSNALAIGPAIPPTAISPNLPPLLPGQLLRNKPAYVPKEYPQQAPRETIEKPDGTLPYLPDMLSRGATMSGLPGTPATASGVRMSAAAAASPALGSVAKVGVVKIPLTATTSETVKTVMVDFDQAGKKWYNKRSFKLIIKGIEATDTRIAAHATPKAPSWNATARTLTVELPKADKIPIELSSFTNPADLNLFEVYEWGTRPFVRKTTIGRIVGLKQMALPTAATLPTLVKATMTPNLKALVGVSILGRNWTITPHDKLTLIHAVQQPLIAPKFTTNARVNRSKGDTFGVLVDWMPIHGKSTSKLDVEAQWHENVDDPSAGAPKWKDPNGADTSVARKEKAFNVTVGPGDTTVLDLGLKLIKKPTFAIISALAANPKANAQRHFFGDTHHRLINYRATAATRFPEFFADNPDAIFTRTSPEAAIHVPSSARPKPPNVAYVIPTYGWTKTDTTSKRSAGGLRVYMERPWFTSGDDEQLAVVLTPLTSTLQTRYHTQWGDDPIWSSTGRLGTTRPTVNHFQGRAGVANGLTLAEDGSTASIAAYNVDFDAERDMWFADMRISPGGAYFPFVKLVLARFQKYSVTGLELSPVVFADFAQLAPERSASIQWSVDQRGTKLLAVTVTGQTYSESHVSKFHGGNKATVTAQFERQLGTQSDAENSPTGWLPVGNEVALAKQGLNAILIIAGITSSTWKGTLTYPTAPGTYRLVLREYEWFHTADAPLSTIGLPPQKARLVYADTFPLTPPQVL